MRKGGLCQFINYCEFAPGELRAGIFPARLLERPLMMMDQEAAPGLQRKKDLGEPQPQMTKHPWAFCFPNIQGKKQVKKLVSEGGFEEII